MHYIGLIGKYNPIISDTRIPDRYDPKNDIDTIYPANFCHVIFDCLYMNDDRTCPYIDNCPLKDD